MEREKINWIPVIELAVLAFTTLGTTITLFLHSDAKAEESRRETYAIIESIRLDIKDFHGKLCAIEERKLDK